MDDIGQLPALGAVIEFIVTGQDIVKDKRTLDSDIASIATNAELCSDRLREVRASLGTFSSSTAVAKPLESSSLCFLVHASLHAVDDVLLRIDGGQPRGTTAALIAGRPTTPRWWTDDDIPHFKACLGNLQDALEREVIPGLRSTISVTRLANLAKHNDLNSFAKKAIEILSGKNALSSTKDAAKDATQYGTKTAHKDTAAIDAFTEVPEQHFSSLSSAHSMPIRDDATLQEQVLSDKGETLQDFVLERLRFAAMKDREEEVATAHDRTFQWLFDPQLEQNHIDSKDKSFLDWLKQDESTIYWVTGKPGSGKSTLMRFLYDHRETQRLLRSWALYRHKKPVTTAAFFFWIAGSIEQRSQVGLLRYLLYQLLSAHRLLIPFALPELWSKLWISSTQERIRMELVWRLPELVAGLKLFLHHVKKEADVALFIDGLDELDGDHTAMIQLLKSIVNDYGEQVKMCVSSRPWPVFEAAFSSVPGLKLQDLTLSDMAQYIDDKLLNEPQVKQLVLRDTSGGEHLKKAIINKASGVFLWVTLGVRLLLDDLDAEHTLVDLQHRLDTIPSDLSELFHHILFEVLTKTRLADTSRILQIIRAREAVCDFTRDQSSASMTLWELSLACEENPDLALGAAIQQASEKVILSRCKNMKNRINTNCVGFLGIHDKPPSKEDLGLRFVGEEAADERMRLPNSRIIYIHRTARDYLFTTGIWDILIQEAQTSTTANEAAVAFDPHICHLRACILGLKLPLFKPERHRRLNERWPTVILAMSHARFITQVTSHSSGAPESVQLIDEFNETMNDIWLQRGRYETDNWVRQSFATYEDRNKHKSTRFDQPFLSLAVKFGLVEYLKHKVATGEAHAQPETHDSTPLLSYATEYLISRQNSVHPLSSPTIISTLLEHGADPNFEYKTMAGKDETPWRAVLRAVRQARRREWISAFEVRVEEVPRWAGIVKLYLEAGGEPGIVLEKDVKDREISVGALLEDVAWKYGSQVLMEVKELLGEKAAAAR